MLLTDHRNSTPCTACPSIPSPQLLHQFWEHLMATSLAQLNSTPPYPTNPLKTAPQGEVQSSEKSFK